MFLKSWFPGVRWDHSRETILPVYYKKALKIFSRISQRFSIRLGSNYHWVKEIQVYSNAGPGPLQRGR
jgi:hypothetical protein